MSVCNACILAGGSICSATFICNVCHQERSVCTHLPGGLERYTEVVMREGAECMMCAEKHTMSEEWINRFHKRKAE